MADGISMAIWIIQIIQEHGLWMYYEILKPINFDCLLL